MIYASGFLVGLGLLGFGVSGLGAWFVAFWDCGGVVLFGCFLGLCLVVDFPGCFSLAWGWYNIHFCEFVGISGFGIWWVLWFGFVDLVACCGLWFGGMYSVIFGDLGLIGFAVFRGCGFLGLWWICVFRAVSGFRSLLWIWALWLICLGVLVFGVGIVYISAGF